MQSKITDMISDIDSMCRDMRRMTESTVLYCAENIIARKQRSLIRARSPKLATLISAEKDKNKTKGKIVYKVGYNTETIKANMESVIMEFGRPGKSRFAKKTFTRKSKNGKNTEVRTGKVRATPHIRLGFFSSRKEAYDYADEQYDKVLKTW